MEPYEYRVLHKNEVDLLFDHLVTVFSFKKIPPSREYFERHFANDEPPRNYRAIYVAVRRSDNKIVSTLRLFHRQVYVSSQRIPCIGIADVATLSEEQNRGHVRRLFELVFRELPREIKVASLHTSNVPEVYEKFGFHAVNREFIKLKIHCQPSIANETNEKVVCIPFNQECVIKHPDIIPQLIRSHDSFCKSFDGVFVRTSELYWQSWVIAECGGNVWFDPIQTPMGLVAIQKVSDGDGVLVCGFLAANVNREANGSIREFVYNINQSGILSLSETFSFLVRSFLDKKSVELGDIGPKTVTLSCPYPIIHHYGISLDDQYASRKLGMQIEADPSQVIKEQGTMYKICGDGDQHAIIIRPEAHLFFDTDSY